MERVHYRNEVSDGPSEAIWGDSEIARACEDPSFGYHHFDDFMACPPIAAAVSNTMVGDYRAFTSAAATIVDAQIVGGVLALNSATDAQAAAIAQAMYPVKIPGAAAGATPAGKKMAFEARIKTSTIAATTHEFFFGLIDNTALSAIVPMTDTAATLSAAAASIIGFHRHETTGSSIDVTYCNATTHAHVKEGAITVATSTNGKGETVPALAADTFIKLGGLYVPNKVDANGNNLSFYANGILLDNGLTNAQIAALTTLAADFLGLVFAIRMAVSVSSTSYLDWWKIAQVR